MRKLKWMFVVLMWFSISSCTTVRGTTRPIELEGGFRVLIPSELTIVSTSPVEDFVIYNISNVAGENIFNIYVGNHPKSVRVGLKSAAITSRKIGPFTVDIASMPAPGNKFDGDARITVASDGWPTNIVFSYKNATSSQRSEIESVIFSFARK